MIAQKVQKLSGFPAELGMLYDVRQWHAADQDDEVRRLMASPALLETMASFYGLRPDLEIDLPGRDEDLARRVLAKRRE